jgi:hypothetical protein
MPNFFQRRSRPWTGRSRPLRRSFRRVRRWLSELHENDDDLVTATARHSRHLRSDPDQFIVKQ